jgi:nicotinamidase-related amidase
MNDPTRALLVPALAAALLTLAPSAPLAAEPPKAPSSPAPAALALDAKRTALLVMDYQNDIVDLLPAEEREPLLGRAASLVAGARQAGVPVLYVVVRFRDGYPEVSPQNPRFAGVKKMGLVREGTPGAEIHAKVAPRPGDVVVTKRRVGAFSTTDLETILRAKDIHTLVLAGIATSGVVLSTVRWAFDMDYSMVVVADACADRDAEVHRVLTQKVLLAQATVVSTAEALQALGSAK